MDGPVPAIRDAVLTSEKPRLPPRLRAVGELLAICVVPVAASEAILPVIGQKSPQVRLATWALSLAAVLASLAWRRLRWPAISLLLAALAAAQFGYASLGIDAYSKPFIGHVAGAAVCAWFWSLLTLLGAGAAAWRRAALGVSRVVLGLGIVVTLAVTGLLLSGGDRWLRPPPITRQDVIWAMRLPGDAEPGRRLWQLSSRTRLEASASTTDPLRQVLEVRQTQPAMQPDQVVLRRAAIEFDPTRDYELRLRARGSPARSVHLELVDPGQTQPPLDIGQAELSPQWQTLVFPIRGEVAGQAGGSADGPAPRDLVLSLGGPAGQTEITDAVLSLVALREPTEIVADLWHVETSNGSRARLLPHGAEPGSVGVAIEAIAPGPEEASVKLVQGGLELRAAARYRLALRARAEGARTVVLGWVDTQTGAALAPWQRVDLGPTATEVTSLCNPATGTASAQLEIHLGSSTAGVTLDAARIDEVPRQTPTEIVPDGFTLEQDPGCKASWAIAGGTEPVLRVSVEQTIPERIAAVRLVQPGLELTAGWPYRLTFRARADGPRPLAWSLIQGDQVILPVQTAWADVDQTWQSLESQFLAPTSGTAKLQFEFGLWTVPCELADIRLEAPRKEHPTELLPDRWRLETAAEAQAHLEQTGESPTALRVVVESVPGPEPWHVRLVQNQIGLTQGNRYRLRFRARADAPRSVGYSLLSTRPGTYLGLFGESPVGASWSDYEIPFTAEADDPGASLSLNLGGTPGAIELDSLQIVATARRWPSELVPDLWRLDLPPGVEGRLVLPARSNDVLRAEFARQADTAPWQIGLKQPGLALRGAVRYRLSFRARADAPRQMPCLILASQASQPLMEDQFALTPQWQTHSVTFTSPRTDEAATLVLNLGGEDPAVELAELQLREEPKESPLALPLGDWRLTVRPDLRAHRVLDGEASERLRIEIDPFGDRPIEPWSVALEQTGVGVESGVWYSATFRARADAPRTASFAILRADDGGFLGLYEDLKLTTAWQDYRLTFQAQGDSPNSRAFFNLGQADAAVELESIELARLARPAGAVAIDQPLSENQSLVLGGLPFGHWRLRVRPLRQLSARVTQPANQGEALRVDLVHGQQGSPPDVRLSLDDLSVRQGQWYTASFRVRAEEPRLMRLSFAEQAPPFESLGLDRAIPVTTRWRTIVLELRATKNTTVGSLALELAGHDAAIELAEFVWQPHSPRATKIGWVVSNLVVALITAWMTRTRRWAAFAPSDDWEPLGLPAPAHSREIRYQLGAEAPQAASPPAGLVPDAANGDALGRGPRD